MLAETSFKALWPLIITFIVPWLIMLSGRHPNLRESWSFAGAISVFFSVAVLWPDVLDGKIYQYTVFTLLPGVKVSFCVDSLSLVFASIASLLWILATSYNIGYMRSLKEHAQTRYYTCFAIAIFGAMGVALSGNIFTLYLFYEIITFFTYPLVAHHQDEEAYEAGKKYLVYLVGTAKLFFLPAMILTYVMTGTLDYSIGEVVHGIFPVDANPILVTIVYFLYIAGFAKAAIMPLHNWLPSAMVAPTPVSALLHAVAVVKAGVFSISRIILSVFGVELLQNLHLGIITAYLACFTITLASIIALTKDDLKARLAYSTVSQLSYIVLGVALLTPSSVTGGLIHIFNHGFSKITLFFCAGAIFTATGLRKISQMGSIGRRMPWTLGAFAVAALSMIGTPPVCGFVSKWYLILGSLQQQQALIVAVLLVSSFLNAAYFAPIVFKAFFGKPHPEVSLNKINEASPMMVAALLITAVGSVAFGLYPNLFLKLLEGLW